MVCSMGRDVGMYSMRKAFGREGTRIKKDQSEVNYFDDPHSGVLHKQEATCDLPVFLQLSPSSKARLERK